MAKKWQRLGVAKKWQRLGVTKKWQRLGVAKKWQRLGVAKNWQTVGVRIINGNIHKPSAVGSASPAVLVPCSTSIF